MIDSIIQDLENKLSIKIDKNNIKYFNDGVSGSIVFKYDKYLVKTTDIKELEAYLEFFNLYNQDYFQKIICYDKNLLYICFDFIEGDLFKYKSLDSKSFVEQVYEITRNYKEYDYDEYGYLEEDKMTWIDFLKEESYNESKKIDIDYSLLFESYKIIEKNICPKYLIHGDLGTHNFIVNNKKIYVIDPIPMVGDYLYDFYFSIFTDSNVFKNLDVDYILSFFNDRDYEYKRALMIICFFIRLRRSVKYSPEELPIYIEFLGGFMKEKRMNKEELEEVIRELGIPKEEFYVLSSGNLVLRGLFKDAGDLDICVSKKGLDLLKNKFDLKKKENNFYQVNDKVECIVEDLSKRKYDDLGDYNGQSLEEYYEFLINSKREKDKIRLEIVEKELNK